MKVAVTVTIDVDPEAYREEYAEPKATREEMREYVRDVATEGVRQAFLRLSYVDAASIERR